MKDKLILLLFCSCFVMNAQTHRYFYQVSYKSDSLDKTFKTENVVLDISKSQVKFYPADILKKDSIRQRTGEYSYSYSQFNNIVTRKINSDVNTNYIALSPKYYSYETRDDQDWKILPDTKEQDGIEMQKATTQFGGRTWTAWFTSSIPFQEGPYKFRGLPGLIVELRDNKDQYIFRLFKSQTIPQEFDSSYYIENLNTEKPLKITQKALKKLLLDYYSNPLKDMHSGLMVMKNGKMVKMDSRDLIQRQQDYIRKNNNPIEIDQAIHYPPR